MYKSKLYLLYQSLDKLSLRKFRKWLQSPVHNEHVLVQQLFYFIETRKSYTAMTLSKERAWKYLFPKEAYNDLRLRHLMSIALDVLEQFVRYKESEKIAFFQEKTIANYLLEQKLEKQAAQKLKKATILLSKTVVDEHYYYHQYELELLQLEYYGPENRSGELNIDAVMNNARLFFMITTLRHAYTALSHQRLRKVHYQIPMLEAILEEIETNDYTAYPILQVYYHSYYTLKKPDETIHFDLLKSYLHNDTLEAKEQRNILLICINYAIRRINIGQLEYAKETFQLYQYGIETGALLDEGKLSPYTYKNIVTVGLNLKEYDWIAFFIEEYSTTLPTHLQESYRHFNTAKLAFDRGDLAQAMTDLLQVEYNEILLNIGAKVLLLKIYYQQVDYDALEALLDSFRIFLQRKKALAASKENYLNLLLFTRKLLALSSDKESTQVLRQEIENTSQLAERKWLLEQL